MKAFIFSFLISSFAQAEYRAHELLLVNTDSGEEKVVISQLDHLQYAEHNPLPPTMAVRYVTSWMCRGRTNDRPICAKPERQSQPDQGI